MSDHQVLRCAGCGALCGPTYASRILGPAPDGRGVLCVACARWLARAILRRGEASVRGWRRWDRDY